MFRIALSTNLEVFGNKALIISYYYDISANVFFAVPVWSSISIAGTRLMDLNPAIGTAEDPEDWQQLHKNVVTAAYDVIKLKSYTSWGIGLCTASIVENILKDTNRVEAVSTYVKVRKLRVYRIKIQAAERKH